jgi:hypothetical protein
MAISETEQRRLSIRSERLPPICFLVAIFLLACCVPSGAQTGQFLPEVDTYFQLNSNTRIWFQAKGTREARLPVQAEIGPSLDFYIKSLPRLAAVGVVDPDKSADRLLVLSIGYRYLPQANGAPATNRMEPVATVQVPLKAGFTLVDRNRGDLDWQTGDFTWRYRNRLQLQRGFTVVSQRLTPYASAEVYYQSIYGKWSETNLNAGLVIPLRKVIGFNVYYQHENNTGHAPNKQVNALGLIVNLYLPVR